MTRIFLFLFIVFSIGVCKADEGENLFNSKQFAKAAGFYEVQLKKKPFDTQLNYRYGRCMFELKNYEQALKHFLLSGTKNAQRDQYLGDAYFYTYRFEEALAAYQNQLLNLKPDDALYSTIQQKVKRTELGAKLLSKVDDIAIVDSQLVNKSEFLKFYKITSELGKLNQESIRLSGKRITDKISYTTQRGDRIFYSDSVHGQMDIFTAYKLLDTWSDATAVSEPINTMSNENYPFLLLDGITLYFASDNENSLGGLDIFVTRFTPSTNTYLQPENVGFPFNSTANDYMMAIDEIHNLAWFATDRNQTSGKVMIYTFVPNAIKSIVRTDNTDALRKFASLSSYRKAGSKSNPEAVLNKPNSTDSIADIHFVINDSVQYKSFDEFRNPEAAKLMKDLLLIQSKSRSLDKTLQNSRQKYTTCETDIDREKIGLEIIKTEKEYFELAFQIENLIQHIRNSENKTLSDTPGN